MSFSNPGYRKKPLWIYIVALIFILTPLGNLLWSLASLNIPNWYMPHVWRYWAKYVAPSTWVLLTLLFVSGISLLFVRRWSWLLSLVTLGVVAVYDIVMIKEFSIMGTMAIAAMIVGTVCFGLLLYFTEFRKPYLNPRVRWWETSPRYKVDLPVALRNIETPATLVDISRTGVLIEFVAAIPEVEGDTEISLPTQVQLPCVVARKTEKGYGLQFAPLNRQQKGELKTFIRTLSEDPRKLQR
jgi:hypothetical protein